MFSSLYKNPELYKKTYFTKYPVRLGVRSCLTCLRMLHSYICNVGTVHCRGCFFLSQGYYDTMDAGFRLASGHVSIMSRTDDVFNVAGHRFKTGYIVLVRVPSK